MKIEITADDMRRIKKLGEGWMVVPGTKPLTPAEVVRRLVDQEWDVAHPREYVSPCEDTGR